MAAPRSVTRSFAGGEMSPEMHGRIDDVKFQNGTARSRNMISKAQGPLVRRPGLGWVDASPDPSNRSRLIDFVYSSDQTVVLQLGRHTVDGRSIGFIRFHTGGQTQLFTEPRAYVTPQNFLPADVTPTQDTITFAQPHLLQTGDPVVLTTSASPTWPTILGGASLAPLVTYYALVVSSTAIKLASSHANALGGFGLNLITAGSWGSGEVRMHFAYQPGDLTRWSGTTPGDFYCMVVPWLTHLDHPPTDTDYWVREPADMVYEIPHFWSDADLFDINPGCQSADVLTIVHPTYRPVELRRESATRWTLSEPQFTPRLSWPSGTVITVTGNGGGAIRALSSSAVSQRLTLQSIHQWTAGDVVRVTGLSAAAPVGCSIPDGLYVVNDPTLGSSPGTFLGLRFVDGGAVVPMDTNASLPGTSRVRKASLASDDVEFYVVTALTALGEESLPSPAGSVTNNLSVPGSFNTVSWAAVGGATRYRVYKLQSGVYGLIGISETTSFKDDNFEPDTAVTPPKHDGALQVVATVTFDTTNDLVLWAGHGLLAGQPVVFTTNGALPGLQQAQTYFVVNPTTDAFQVSATPDGLVEPLNGGSGTHAARTGAWPGAVGYHQGRRGFGGARMTPQDFRLTRSGTESDLSYHLPVQADDRIEGRLQSREVCTIRHLVSLGDLLVFTNSAEFRLAAQSGTVLKPGAIDAQSDTYVGSSKVKPLVRGKSVLFAAARGGHLHEGGFTATNGKFVEGDVSLRAAHLFDGEEIVQMAFQKAPLPIAWVVSTSGRLLALTYVPEEAVGAFAWMDTDGFFESVAVVAEGREDRVYVVVRRVVNGATVRFVERLAPLQFGALKDAFFVDSGLSFDGTNTNPALTVTISGTTSWGSGQVVTLTAAAPGIFQHPATTDVGDELRFTAADGSVHVVEITGTSSAQVATGKIRSRSLPADLRGAATAAWAWARDTFAIPHLEGKTVKILADAEVQPAQVVAGGVITLAAPKVRVHAGLGYKPQYLSLPVTMQVNGFGQGRTKTVSKAHVRVVDSGPFQIGVEKDGVANVVTARSSDGELLAGGKLHTAQVAARVPDNWTDDGQILIEQDDPLPLTITSLVLEVAVGG